MIVTWYLLGRIRTSAGRRYLQGRPCWQRFSNSQGGRQERTVQALVSEPGFSPMSVVASERDEACAGRLSVEGERGEDTKIVDHESSSSHLLATARDELIQPDHKATML
ncbi:Hypothetical protein NTJ_01477 [Nesidiocoris tenuis]|uniref:Uncharacterized protein n=1 Tax=Nesidiocoris tenuis TaxID=355587 RepID=A0ABN7A8Z1_9HEMI|nr:Hypothetical protein NTJ_01477 [Nesidiocoris tenuis]